MSPSGGECGQELQLSLAGVLMPVRGDVAPWPGSAPDSSGTPPPSTSQPCHIPLDLLGGGGAHGWAVGAAPGRQPARAQDYPPPGRLNDSPPRMPPS